MSVTEILDIANSIKEKDGLILKNGQTTINKLSSEVKR